MMGSTQLHHPLADGEGHGVRSDAVEVGLALGPTVGEENEDAEQLWGRLLKSLTAWLRRRAGPPIDSEDVAAEIVLRAFQFIRSSGAKPWLTMWSWSITTARNIIADGVRHPAGLRHQDIDSLPRLVGQEDHKGTSRELRELLEQLRSECGGTQIRMLDLMSDGPITNREMAERLNLSLRGAEKARQKLRQVAEGIFADEGGPDRL